MRRHGQYGVASGNAAYSSPVQMQHVSGQRIEHKSNTSSYQGRPESMASEKEHLYGTTRGDRQWGWERDGSSSHMFNEGKLLLLLFLFIYSYSLHLCMFILMGNRDRVFSVFMRIDFFYPIMLAFFVYKNREKAEDIRMKIISCFTCLIPLHIQRMSKDKFLRLLLVVIARYCSFTR